MDDGLVFRPARESDFAEVQRISAHLYEGRDVLYVSFIDYVRNKNRALYVAEKQGKIVSKLQSKCMYSCKLVSYPVSLFLFCLFQIVVLMYLVIDGGRTLAIEGGRSDPHNTPKNAFRKLRDYSRADMCKKWPKAKATPTYSVIFGHYWVNNPKTYMEKIIHLV